MLVFIDESEDVGWNLNKKSESNPILSERRHTATVRVMTHFQR